MPIVEGYGDVAAVPILIRRICTELLVDVVPHVLAPIRQPRNRLLNDVEGCLGNAANLAVGKLRQHYVRDAKDLILILVDADESCAAQLGPDTLVKATSHRSDADIAVVFAVMEYETWFVAGAASLAEF